MYYIGGFFLLDNDMIPYLCTVVQWFLTLLEVLNPTSSIQAFIEPFVVGKIKCVLSTFFFTFIAQNLLSPTP